MTHQDWLMTDDGTCHPCPISATSAEVERPYRLYRFLTDLEDILATYPDDVTRLAQLRPLVRRLLVNSPWLQGQYLEPHPTLGWSVLMLYEEPDFAITLQTVTWLPGRSSPIHNHGTWGIVALIDGQERNTLWRRSPTPDYPDRIETRGDRLMAPGDIMSFTAGAIHQIEVLGDHPSISLNVYGETNFRERFEFDPVTHGARRF